MYVHLGENRDRSVTRLHDQGRKVDYCDGRVLICFSDQNTTVTTIEGGVAVFCTTGEQDDIPKEIVTLIPNGDKDAVRLMVGAAAFRTNAACDLYEQSMED